MKPKYIIIRGNPIDGFFYYGPFEHLTELNEYAKKFNSDWWFVDLIGKDDNK